MTDLRQHLRELDQMETPDMRASIDQRVTEIYSTAPETVVRVSSQAWRGPLIAVGTALAILVVVGASILILGINPGDVADPTIQPSATTVPPTATTMSPPSEAWAPILSTTVAKPAPPAATCPAGTSPNIPGPTDQEHPGPGWASNQAAAFDRHTGRIVFVDLAGDTWTFDVCTNMWQKMNPTGSPVTFEFPNAAASEPSNRIGDLVYDVDSDVTIVFGSKSLTVYDANANTWTQKSYPPGIVYGSGAVYDPVSGLVIAAHFESFADHFDNPEKVSAYDVDTDEWTPIGSVGGNSEEETLFGSLVGYSWETDRLIFQGYDVGMTRPSGPSSGAVVNPRNGELTPLPEPGPALGGGSGMYATSTGTAFVQTSDGRVCRFDPTTLDWDTCFDAPEAVTPSLAHTAMVGDPINNRLVLIKGVGWTHAQATGDIWAIDLDNGEWIRLFDDRR